jgi:hypothetical protein
MKIILIIGRTSETVWYVPWKLTGSLLLLSFLAKLILCM